MENFFSLKSGEPPTFLFYNLGHRHLRSSLFIIGLSFLVEIVGVSSSYSSEKKFPVVPPAVFSSVNFPCSQCHADLKTNFEKRKLGQHLEIEFRDHAEDTRWCLGCHDPTNRDALLLVTGEKVAFDVSYKICRQCHGSTYNDWQQGLHGKRIGNWDGRPQYYLCAACHNPHTPRFSSVTPEPPPIAPEKTLKRQR